MSNLEKVFPEYVELERLIEKIGNKARIVPCAEMEYRGKKFIQYGISMGTQDPNAPTFGITGGVHGLERIGSRVVLSFLQAATSLLHWDKTFNQFLEQRRIVFMPIVNPVGIYLKVRSNGNGVDLMRNAPVDSEDSSFLAGGHRISKYLPWYRGQQHGPMEKESHGLCEFVRREGFSSKALVTLDVHSGYGTVDRLWFPYAKTKQPFPHIAEASALKELFESTFPNHIYVIEPQSKQYTTHGDLWDYLYDEYCHKYPQQTYLPLSLEMGSWIWVKKNPRQFFSILGIFNPVMNHRLKRTLRRHLTLFDFLMRAVASHDSWANLTLNDKKIHEAKALSLWYPNESSNKVA